MNIQIEKPEMNRSMWRKSLCALGLAAAVALTAHAQTFNVLYTFSGGADGGYPQYGRLIADNSGNLYGTAAFGGNWDCAVAGGPGPGCGVVFKLDPLTGVETVLYTFNGTTDGAQPWSGLIHDAAFNLYGTAAYGGANGAGVIYQVNPSGQETVLHSFAFSDGAYPSGDLIADPAGNLYGTTITGGDSSVCQGAGCGVIFKYSPSGELQVLHNFYGQGEQDGANPTHGLSRDQSNTIYGTAENGGFNYCDNYEGSEAVDTFITGCGTIFMMQPAGLATVYRFSGGTDGSDPRTTLIWDDAGNAYGTTFYGGLYSAGTIFKLDPSGNETILYNFRGLNDGANPWGGVVLDTTGNLYGTTNHAGGSCYCGTVFKLDTEGNLKVLHTFAGTDGQYPEAPLRISNGAVYGVTSGGGTLSDGTAGTGVIFQVIL